MEMLKDLAGSFDTVKQTFEEASDVLGYDMWKLAQEGPEEELNTTERTQPALLTAGVAVSRVWQAQGGAQPIVCAGHSLGEYTALVFAGALDFATGLELVEARGQFMQGAVPQGTGAMAAILGLPDEQVEAVCAEAAQGEVVSPANFNAPGQVVIAGHAAAVDRAIEGAKAAKAKRALKLAVSVPSHCELMRPAVDKLAERLGAIGTPTVAVIHNVDAHSRSDSAAIADALKEQLYKPVRWVQCMEKIAADGATAIVECGPGKVLVGLNKRIVKEAKHVCVQDAKSLDEALGLG
jgi:[acyl-carrier-protein] S-malonyltransferase